MPPTRSVVVDGRAHSFPFTTNQYITVQRIKKKTGVFGIYYVNDGCIGCSICAEIARDNFGFNHEAGCSTVEKQPETDKEAVLCIEVKDICPVDAIEVTGAP